MQYIGLDLSLVATGYARLSASQGPQTGVLPPAHRKGVQRLAHIRSRLLEVIPRGPAVFAVEGYAMGARGNTFDIGEWGGVAKLALYERGDCAVLIVPPSNLKQFVTGRGNAKKHEVMSSVHEVFRVPITNDNEADALGLAWMAQVWHLQSPLESYQYKAMSKVHPCFPLPEHVRPLRKRRRAET